MNTLWEADVVVFKAHITTGPGGKVLDMFWIYDNRCELPENHRSVAGPRFCVPLLQRVHPTHGGFDAKHQVHRLCILAAQSQAMQSFVCTHLT